MPNDVNSILKLDYPGQSANPVQNALSMDYPGQDTPAKPNPAAAPSTGKRIAQGLGDTEYGLGQLAEHVPGLNVIIGGWRGIIQQSLKSAGFNNASDALGGDPTSGDITDQKAADNFDSIVQQRERDYQAARSAAAQTGIDWWRLAGQAINPINYLTPGGPASSVLGRIGQGAVQGALISGEQPDTSNAPGDFWWNKAKNISLGAVMGGAASSVVEAAIPALNWALKKAANVLGSSASATAAASAVVNDALRSQNIDPNSVDLNVLAGLRQEAQEALNSGAEVSKEAIANRAISESLPTPIQLTRGQATRDAMQFAREQNLRGIQGVGESITNRLVQQNQAILDNLDKLGAQDASDVVNTGNQISSTVQKYWDGLQQQKTQLYDAVRNSQGLSAAVDGQAAGQEIRETLGSPQAFHAWMTLPENIKQTVSDLEDGTLDLTVSNLQALDKSWGQAAASADASTAHAINEARKILGNAQIQDDVGQDAMKAWTAAKQAHAQQMSLLEPKLLNGMPNPSYQPLVKAIIQDGKAPETLFQTHFMNAAPSVGKGNLDFLSSIDPQSKSLISNTLMGEIKRQAIGSSADANPSVSEAVLRGWAGSPVQSAKLEALTSPAQAQTFQNLAHTVEMIKKPPVASAVNTSNTGSAVINAAASALKSGATAQLLKRIPLVGDVMPVINAAQTESAVQGALNPGVTLKSLLSATPSQAATNRTLSRLITPALVASQTQPKKPKQ